MWSDVVFTSQVEMQQFRPTCCPIRCLSKISANKRGGEKMQCKEIHRNTWVLVTPRETFTNTDEKHSAQIAGPLSHDEYFLSPEFRILGISLGALPVSAAGGCQQAFPRVGGCFWTWLGSQGAIPTSFAECQVAVADIFTHLIFFFFFCLWQMVLSYWISKEMGWVLHETEGRVVLT